ncbi:MAG: hypothetical protein ABIQ72_03005 [Usitatibacter sp.]
MKKLLAIFLAALGFSLPASATTYSVDYTDIWYNAPAESESGWGVNIIQQNEVLFVTLFVYGTDGSPRWYVGPNVFASNTITYGGTLYSVVGSYFGAPWNPPSTASPVGSINFSFASPNSGILSYNVNGVTVTKNITRQTFKGDNLGGNYIGGTTARGSACGGNGGILISGELTVSHNNTAIGMTVDFVSSGGLNSRCTYAGTYEQAGRLGAIKSGTFNCTIGTTNNALVGNFEVTEITTSRTGFTGAFAGQDQFCAYSGFFGGTKDVF